MSQLTFGSLFAGIGGFDRGLEAAGMACRWQVEISKFALSVLERHWPDVRRWPDIRTFPPKPVDDWYVDVICGGFPCQDISLAGPGEGIEGERSGLWRDFASIIRTLRPRYVVVENVSALLVRGFGSVLGDLAESGYNAEWDCLPAAAFGAHHIRDRVFIIAARADTECLRPQGVWTPPQGPWSRQQFERLVQTELSLSLPAGRSGGIYHGVSHRKQRLLCLGNAILPQIGEWIGCRIVENWLLQ